MTTSNHPENQQNLGGATDLGQISIKGKTICSLYRLADEARQEISITYYGNKNKPGASPDNEAQVMIHMPRATTGLYLKPNELRQLAAYFCEAAAAIENGQREFDEHQYYGR